MENWEIKDYITVMGIVLTFGVAVWSLIVSKRNSRKTLFINTVTAARVKYIETVRNSISDFCALIYHYTITELDQTQRQAIVQNIDKLRYLIKLQLNRHEEIDRRIIDLVNLLPDLAIPQKLSELEATINKLVNLTQDLLKGEWEGIKKEAIRGPLTAQEKANTVSKYFQS